MERNRRSKALGTEVAFLRDLRYALSVLLSMDCSQFPSKSSNSTRTMRWLHLHSDRPLPAPPRGPLSHDPPVGSCMPGAVLCRLVFLPVVALPMRLWYLPPQLAIGSYSFIFQFVEECLQARRHVGKHNRRKQCFHTMSQRQPSWPAPPDCGLVSSSKSCFKPGSTRIPFLCLGSFHVLPSTSGI